MLREFPDMASVPTGTPLPSYMHIPMAIVLGLHLCNLQYPTKPILDSIILDHSIYSVQVLPFIQYR